MLSKDDVGIRLNSKRKSMARWKPGSFEEGLLAKEQITEGQQGVKELHGACRKPGLAPAELSCLIATRKEQGYPNTEEDKVVLCSLPKKKQQWHSVLASQSQLHKTVGDKIWPHSLRSISCQGSHLDKPNRQLEYTERHLQIHMAHPPRHKEESGE
jgi:hypothetical protein